MIKRTLYFGNEAYLRTKDKQLVVNLPAKGRAARKWKRNEIILNGARAKT